MDEVWKDVVGYEGKYQVSNLGRVRSLVYFNGHGEFLKRQEPKIMKPTVDNKQYLKVYLNNNKGFRVHRLVAMAFIPNPDGLPQVNHKDENEQNNIVTNLEWCTNDYNYRYGTARIRASRHCCKPINQYELDGTFVKRWNSASETSKYGFTKNTISRVCQGKLHSHKGYLWRYADELQRGRSSV